MRRALAVILATGLGLSVYYLGGLAYLCFFLRVLPRIVVPPEGMLPAPGSSVVRLVGMAVVLGATLSFPFVRLRSQRLLGPIALGGLAMISVNTYAVSVYVHLLAGVAFAAIVAAATLTAAFFAEFALRVVGRQAAALRQTMIAAGLVCIPLTCAVAYGWFAANHVLNLFGGSWAVTATYILGVGVLTPAVAGALVWRVGAKEVRLGAGPMMVAAGICGPGGLIVMGFLPSNPTGWAFIALQYLAAVGALFLISWIANKRASRVARTTLATGAS